MWEEVEEMSNYPDTPLDCSDEWLASIGERRAMFRKQLQQAKGEQPNVECASCHHAKPLRFLYKCLYCGLWFCERCMEVHLGKTRTEYKAEHPEEFSVVDGGTNIS